MTKGPPKRTILSSTNFLNPLRSKLLGQKYPETCARAGARAGVSGRRQAGEGGGGGRTKKNVDIKYLRVGAGDGGRQWITPSRQGLGEGKS